MRKERTAAAASRKAVKLFVVVFLLCAVQFPAMACEGCFAIRLETSKNLEALKKRVLKIPVHLQAGILVYKEKGRYVAVGPSSKDVVFIKKQLAEFKPFYETAYIVALDIDKKEVVYSPFDTPAYTQKFQDNPQLAFMMLQSFLGVQDFKSAYRLSDAMVRYYPQSGEWRRWRAKVALWNGESSRALDDFYWLARKKNDTEAHEIALDLALQLHRHDKAEVLLHDELERGDTRRRQTYIDVLIRNGDPERAVGEWWAWYALEPSPEKLVEIVLLQMSYGDIEGAKETLDFHREHYSLTPQNALVYARIYYLRGDIEEANELLASAEASALPEEHEFWKLRGDLAWVSGEIEDAIRAAEVLYDSGQARQQEINRLLSYYYDEKSGFAQEVALRGYETFHLPYLLASYYMLALKNNGCHELLQFDAALSDAEKETMSRQRNYWYVRIECNNRLGRSEDAKALYREALAYFKGDASFYASLIWWHIDNRSYKELETLLDNEAGFAQRTSQLWQVYTIGYMVLNRPDRAKPFAEKALESDPENILYMVNYAQVAEQLHRLEEANYWRYRAWQKVRNSEDAGALYYGSSEQMRLYYTLALYFGTAPDIDAMMLRAETELNAREYVSLEISRALMQNEHDKVRSYRNSSAFEPWVMLNLAMVDDDTILMQRLLRSHPFALTRSDKAEALLGIGAVSEAQSVLFSETMTIDDSIYMKYHETAMNYGKKAYGSLSWNDRQGVTYNDLEASVETTTGKSSLALAEMRYRRNSINDTDLLTFVPKEQLKFSAGAAFLYSRGNWTNRIGFASSLKNYLTFSSTIDYGFSGSFRLIGHLGYNDDAEETLYSLLAGTKDNVRLGLEYALMNSLILSASSEYALYHSEDGVELGKGSYSEAQLSYRLRSGYPDVLLRVFAGAGVYDEDAGNKGVIDRLYPYPFLVLPEDFAIYGAGFNIGEPNIGGYTRVWRPYLDGELYENTTTGIGGGLGAGVGGSLFGSDHLRFGYRYIKGVNGTADDFQRAVVDYTYWF
jgi:hypothetical protein